MLQLSKDEWLPGTQLRAGQPVPQAPGHSQGWDTPPASSTPPGLSPELDVEDWRLSEVRHALDVDNLLHLRAPIHCRVHGLGLQAQVCACQGHFNKGSGPSRASLHSPGPGSPAVRDLLKGLRRVVLTLLIWDETFSRVDPTYKCF